MDKEGEISMGGDRIHFYIEKREIEHHYYNFHIYCSFLLILKNQDLTSRVLKKSFSEKIITYMIHVIHEAQDSGMNIRGITLDQGYK